MGVALGAFECGVVQALDEADIHPDIVAGVSIGAFNGAIIAGNPGNSAAALEAFWNDLSRGHAVRTDRNVAARPVFVVEHLVWFSPFLPAAMVAATATVSVDLDEPL